MGFRYFTYVKRCRMEIGCTGYYPSLSIDSIFNLPGVEIGHIWGLFGRRLILSHDASVIESRGKNVGFASTPHGPRTPDMKAHVPRRVWKLRRTRVLLQADRMPVLG